MTNFKIGDRVRSKHFRNEDDYKIGDRVKCIFKKYYNQYIEVGKIYTVEKIDLNYSSLFLKEINDEFEPWSRGCSYMKSSFIKVHSLKDRLKLAKELLK
jgi:hypothetical protein